ncbi:hypothetical protein BDV96DRAFT_577749 [Lophiotrema nucula]|uniref:Zn(2)-C6 fungal-type domain-containing protein n=1 Tax=Lophiotrema nucula TaxID=690887 RepID=A0A6A5Z5B3_9PLEO|nr:hypothetical protein BDV96DRAFT_577749 [Lophiotrema nucula]
MLAMHWASSNNNVEAPKSSPLPAQGSVDVHQPNDKEDKPLFVNPKQFHRIIKRRVTREKLEDELGDDAKRISASSDDDESIDQALSKNVSPTSRDALHTTSSGHVCKRRRIVRTDDSWPESRSLSCNDHSWSTIEVTNDKSHVFDPAASLHIRTTPESSRQSISGQEHGSSLPSSAPSPARQSDRSKLETTVGGDPKSNEKLDDVREAASGDLEQVTQVDTGLSVAGSPPSISKEPEALPPLFGKFHDLYIPPENPRIVNSGMKGFRQRLSRAKENAAKRKSSPIRGTRGSGPLGGRLQRTVPQERAEQVAAPAAHVASEPRLTPQSLPGSPMQHTAMQQRRTSSTGFDPSQMPPGMPPQFDADNLPISWNRMPRSPSFKTKPIDPEDAEWRGFEVHNNDATVSGSFQNNGHDDIRTVKYRGQGKIPSTVAPALAGPAFVDIPPVAPTQFPPLPHPEVPFPHSENCTAPSPYYGVLERTPEPTPSGFSSHDLPGIKWGGQSRYLHRNTIKPLPIFDGVRRLSDASLQSKQSREGTYQQQSGRPTESDSIPPPQQMYYTPYAPPQVPHDMQLQSDVMWSGSRDIEDTGDAEQEKALPSHRTPEDTPQLDAKEGHGDMATSSSDQAETMLPTSIVKSPSINSKMRKRTKSGCLTCRKQRIKCGEERPTCKNCMRKGRQCEGYNQRVVFKPPIGDWPNHPGVVSTVQYHNSTVPGSRIHIPEAQVPGLASIEHDSAYDAVDKKLNLRSSSPTFRKRLLSDIEASDNRALTIDIGALDDVSSSDSSLRGRRSRRRHDEDEDGSNHTTSLRIDLISKSEPRSRRPSWSSSTAAQDSAQPHAQPEPKVNSPTMPDNSKVTNKLANYATPPVSPSAYRALDPPFAVQPKSRPAGMDNNDRRQRQTHSSGYGKKVSISATNSPASALDSQTSIDITTTKSQFSLRPTHLPSLSLPSLASSSSTQHPYDVSHTSRPRKRSRPSIDLPHAVDTEDGALNLEVGKFPKLTSASNKEHEQDTDSDAAKERPQGNENDNPFTSVPGKAPPPPLKPLPDTPARTLPPLSRLLAPLPSEPPQHGHTNNRYGYSSTSMNNMNYSPDYFRGEVAQYFSSAQTKEGTYPQPTTCSPKKRRGRKFEPVLQGKDSSTTLSSTTGRKRQKIFGESESEVLKQPEPLRSGERREMESSGEGRDIVDVLLEQWTIPVGAG